MSGVEPGSLSQQQEVQRMQLIGFLAGALVTLVGLSSGVAFNHRDLYQVLRMEGDGWGYYQYLPGLIGTHHFEHLPWAYILPNASGLDLFTSGVAFLQLPWFLLGHALAWVTGSPMDGYSAPYTLSILLGVSVYTGLATSLLFHALRRRFPPRIALAVPLLLFAGTNLYYYTTRQPSMSHAYVYFLFAWLHYLVVRNREGASPWRTTGIIVVCSLAILIRQLHAVALAFPLLYLVTDRSTFMGRMRWLTQRPWITATGLLLAFMIWLPQLAYWKLITEHLFIFPYGYKGEHFEHVLRPHLLDVLISIRNGWWVYTPLMALVCGSLVWSVIRGVAGGRVLLVLVMLVWYTYAAWWCWWLGGAFGHRGFVEYYALLAIPLAWGLQEVTTHHRRWRIPLALLLTVCMVANLRMTARYVPSWSEPGWTWSQLGSEWRALF